MQEAEIVVRFLVPPNEQAAKALHPGMTAFHHPAPRLEARFSLDGCGFFSTWANMGRKAHELRNEIIGDR